MYFINEKMLWLHFKKWEYKFKEGQKFKKIPKKRKKKKKQLFSFLPFSPRKQLLDEDTFGFF